MNPTTHDQAPTRRGGEGGSFVAAAVAALVVVVACAGVWLYLRVAAEEPGRSRLASYQLREIQAALELYRLQHGRYPTTESGMASLVAATDGGPPLLGSMPRDPWGQPFAYARVKPHAYRVVSAGPDGLWDTDDDVSLTQASSPDEWPAGPLGAAAAPLPAPGAADPAP